MLSNELIEKFQIFSSYPNASILELAVLLKSNRKMVLTDIRKINDILFSVGLPRIQIEESYIQMPDISLNDLFSRMSLDSGEYLFFEERLDMIILYILLNTDFVSNTHLQCLLQMSKNSVLSDLKKARLQAKKYGGQLVYTRQEGYIIRATDTKRMLLLEQVVENILAKASGSWVIKYVLDECQLQINVEEIYNFLYDLGCQYHLVFIFEKTKAVSYLLAVLASQQWEEQTVIGTIFHRETCERVGGFLSFARAETLFYHESVSRMYSRRFDRQSRPVNDFHYGSDYQSSKSLYRD